MALGRAQNTISTVEATHIVLRRLRSIDYVLAVYRGDRGAAHPAPRHNIPFKRNERPEIVLQICYSARAK